jgi:hypothetical protein
MYYYVIIYKSHLRSTCELTRLQQVPTWGARGGQIRGQTSRNLAITPCRIPHLLGGKSDVEICVVFKVDQEAGRLVLPVK